MSETPATFRDGRYRIVGVLGEGAQATTFDAVDAKLGQAVAVKRFQVRGAKSWKEVELAEREARVLAEISHPLLPRYVEHFEESGELFLVTTKIEGESLASLRKRGVTFGEGEVRRLLCDAADTLTYLHGRAPPIIHRDLKPSNVLRRPDGSFAFIDFGAVRDRMKPEGGSTVVGTFGYMAPEQFQGRAMPASDVYAVGATALSLLTGREPEDLPHKGLRLDVPAALSGSRVSPELVEMLSAMLEPDPDRAGAGDRPAARGRSTRRSPPPSRGRRPRRRARRPRPYSLDDRRDRRGGLGAPGRLPLPECARPSGSSPAVMALLAGVASGVTRDPGKSMRDARLGEAGLRATTALAAARRRLAAPNLRIDVRGADAAGRAEPASGRGRRRRRRRTRRLSALRIEPRLQLLGRLEAHRRRGRDVDRLARLRVPPHPGAGQPDREGAEARQRHLPVPLDGGPDLGEGPLDHLGDLPLRELPREPLAHPFHQLPPRHVGLLATPYQRRGGRGTPATGFDVPPPTGPAV